MTAAQDALEDQQYYLTYAAAHASRTPAEIAEDASETALWDGASGDDLDPARL